MAIQATADQALIRKLNTAVILDILRRYAPLSRAEVAARTGLNRSTVSIVVNSLIEEGFVQETELQSSKIGRPGILLVLNPKGGFAHYGVLKNTFMILKGSIPGTQKRLIRFSEPRRKYAHVPEQPPEIQHIVTP